MNMVFLRRTLLSHHFHNLLKHQNHTSHLLTNPIPYISSTTHFIYSNSYKYFTFSSFFQRPISSSAQIDPEFGTSIETIENGDDLKKTKKSKNPLDTESESESENDSGVKKTLMEVKTFRELKELLNSKEPKRDDECLKNNQSETKSKKNPLDIFFKEAMELSEKLEDTESESEGENESGVKKTLRKLEKEVRELKGNSNSKEKPMKMKTESQRDDECLKKNQSKTKSLGLHAMFAKKDGGGDANSESSRREPVVLKKLSPDMLFFLNHLYEGGYFNDANFLPKKAFEVSCFDDIYGREYIKCAAEKFGKDNQEIAKWLSGSDVKLVAQFGCPSLLKKSIFAAKRLRIFFKIQEDTVCSKCVLKQSCKFVNQSIWKGDTRNLHLDDVMRVITLYALEATPPLLVVPNEIKASVSRLLKEALNLSQTTS